MFKILCLIWTCNSPLIGQAIVLDGDTIKVNDQVIRLAGIDAEELNEPNGLTAKYEMRRIVTGRIVSCHDTGERSHNRIVATCYTGSIDIGGELVRRGLALDCKHYSGGKYRSIEPSDARQRLTQKPYCN